MNFNNREGILYAIKRPEVIVIFFLCSIVSLTVWISYISQSILSLLAGLVIVVFFVYDIVHCNYQFNFYQIQLVFAWFSITNPNHFASSERAAFMEEAFEIHCLHFFFLGLGYSLIPYEKSRVTDYRRKQNGFVFLFLLYGTVTSLFAMVSANTTISYAEQFQDFEATRNLPIIQMGFDQMKGLITSAVIFTLSSPLVASSFSVLNSLIGYATNGIKGVVVSNLIVFLSIVQFIYGRISISKMSLIFPIALIGLIGLIATTGFRNRLGFDSLIELNANQMSEYLSYFPNSPELRQLEFTSRLLEFLEEGKTETRYGWDYFRFFFYPVKYLFEDFQYASYNEFAHLFYSEKINAGLYLGLGGELYWNFSYLFFVFSGIIGGLLKIYQNSIGQFGQMGLFFFFSLHHSILWYLYRGAANMLIMETFFVLLLISLYFLIRKIFNENKYKDAILNFLIDSSRINCSKYPESEKDIRK